MTQGGNVDSYRPSIPAPKISPTGRKISVDRVKLSSSELQNISHTSSPSSRTIHIYENLPNITVTSEDTDDVTMSENTDL